MGEMKMGNTVPRVGLEHTFLSFPFSVLPLHHVGSLTSLLYPANLSMQLLAPEVGADYCTHLSGIVSF